MAQVNGTASGKAAGSSKGGAKEGTANPLLAGTKFDPLAARGGEVRLDGAGLCEWFCAVYMVLLAAWPLPSFA